MRLKTTEKLCCPFDKADLKLKIITKDTDEKILEGFFTCSQCKRIYPIVKGIPIMNPDEYREPELERPLLESWKNQLEGKAVENFKIIE
ncbi:Trm112 family protein [Salegentibacter sp. HM20]